MRCILLACAIISAFVSAAAFADEPSVTDRLVKGHYSAAPDRVRNLRLAFDMRMSGVVRARRAPVTGKTVALDASMTYTSFANEPLKRTRIDELQRKAEQVKDEADAIEAGRTLYVEELPLPPVLDAIGRLQPEMPVEQVLSEASLIVRDGRRADYAHPPVQFQPPGGRFSYVVDGISTLGVVDGAVIKMPDVLEITGTRMIKRSNGSTETLFVLTPVDTAPALALLGPLPKPKKKPRR